MSEYELVECSWTVEEPLTVTIQRAAEAMLAISVSTASFTDRFRAAAAIMELALARQT